MKLRLQDGCELEGHLNTFDRLEVAWPYVEEVQEKSKTGDATGVQMVSGMYKVAAAATIDADDLDDADKFAAHLKMLKKSVDMSSLPPFFNYLMEQSKASIKGEAQPGA